VRYRAKELYSTVCKYIAMVTKGGGVVVYLVSGFVQKFDSCT